MPLSDADNLFIDNDFLREIAADPSLALLDARLGTLARADRPSAEGMSRLNARILAETSALLPGGPISITSAPATVRVARGWTWTRSVGRMSLAASILLAFTVALPLLQVTDTSEATSLQMAAEFEASQPAAETVLVALYQETAKASSSVDAVATPAVLRTPAASTVAPVLGSRNASFDDVAAEMSVLLGEDVASSL